MIKLAILFLTQTNDLNQPQVWKEFIESGNGEIVAYCHNKVPLDQSCILKDCIIPQNYPTRWGGFGLSLAMLALLQNAYDDTTNTHFIFASESCIPIKSWQYMKDVLQKDGRSWIQYSYFGDQERDHKIRQFSSHYMSKDWVHSPQWVLLNREATKCVIDNETDIKNFSKVFCSDEHIISTILHSNNFNLEKNVIREACTWSHWDGGWHPRTHDQYDAFLQARLSSSNSFFARKFSSVFDASKLNLHL